MRTKPLILGIQKVTFIILFSKNFLTSTVRILTMIRGKVVMEDGKIVGERGFGRYIPAKVK